MIKLKMERGSIAIYFLYGKIKGTSKYNIRLTWGVYKNKLPGEFNYLNIHLYVSFFKKKHFDFFLYRF